MRTPKMTIRAETARGLKPSRPQRGANKIESEPTYISGHFQRNGRTKASYSANSPAVDPRLLNKKPNQKKTKQKYATYTRGSNKPNPKPNPKTKRNLTTSKKITPRLELEPQPWRIRELLHVISLILEVYR